MKITRRMLRKFIGETIKETRLYRDAFYQNDEPGKYDECLTEDSDEWKTFLKQLSAVKIPYTKYNDPEYPSIKIMYSDVMGVQPSGMRALFTQHKKKYPHMILVVDHDPQDWKDASLGPSGPGAKNDIVVTMMPEEVLKRNLGIKQTEEVDWFYLDRASMNTFPFTC